MWNVDTGVLEFKIAHSAEDSLTTVAWSSDGRKIACGGTRGQFYQCDSKGTVLEQKEGVRVQAMAYRKDNKFILAADTHHRLRSYNLEEEQSDKTVLQESHGIMTFTTDDTDRYALLNIANQVRYCLFIHFISFFIMYFFREYIYGVSKRSASSVNTPA